MDVVEARFSVRTAQWPQDAAALGDIRHQVFVEEQGVPASIEWDGQDACCLHAIAEDAEGHGIGCGRLLPDGHIGRLAVRRDWRGRGAGTALLRHLIGLATTTGHRRVELNAQVHAIAFYARQEFTVVGDVFMEAGIAHQAMERILR